MAKPETRSPGKESREPQGSGPLPPSMPAPSIPIAKWFLSRTVRQATAMVKHVQKLLQHQRDLLSPQAIAALETAMFDLRKTVAGEGDKTAIEQQMAGLETAANKWVKPYPDAAWRENVEVLLVALTVAMGIRTFFLQPFKIPTGSMQPTLYGVTSTPDFTRDSYVDYATARAAMDKVEIPTGWQRVRDWFAGVSYLDIKAKSDGELLNVDPAVNLFGLQLHQPIKLLIFNIVETLNIGGRTHWLWFPPDYGSYSLQQRLGLRRGTLYKKGDQVVRMKIASGDHLFVDRVSYNFRKAERGEIVVFDTHGITGLTPDQQNTFYIKRLVGLGDETLSLKQDYFVTNALGGGVAPVGHLLINGTPLSASTPHFENLYSFYGASRGANVLAYQENHYYGHALLQGLLSPGNEFHVGPDNYFVLGDNTMNSLDGRYWGDFPQSQVIGKAFFVYWPITERFGLSNR